MGDAILWAMPLNTLRTLQSKVDCSLLLVQLLTQILENIAIVFCEDFYLVFWVLCNIDILPQYNGEGRQVSNLLSTHLK